MFSSLAYIPAETSNQCYYLNNLCCCLGNWIVEVPGGAAPGVIMFRNEVCKGILINMNKAGCVGAGKGGRFCHFKVEVLPDNYCMFSSVEFPAFHLNFMANGVAGNVKTATATDSSAQFFIRCEVSKMSRATVVSFVTLSLSLLLCLEKDPVNDTDQHNDSLWKTLHCCKCPLLLLDSSQDYWSACFDDILNTLGTNYIPYFLE